MLHRAAQPRGCPIANVQEQKDRVRERTPEVYIAGIGGFAERHHESLLKLEQQGLVKVRAVCDPGVNQLGELLEKFAFAERGVALYDDFEEMLARHAKDFTSQDWASIAAPFTVHAAMHRQCVEAGLACYLEKPPTLDPLELESMIACDEQARLSTAVGFNHIGQPQRLRLKQRIIEGEFGELKEARLVGAWRRSMGYFQRNAWVGKLLMGNQLVLDSCLGNGMAHHLHNLLFFCGQDELYSWGACESVESELYSVQKVEGPDTLFVQAQMQNGAQLRVAVTNAYDDGEYTSEELEFEHASIVIDPNACIQICWRDGRTETIALPTDFPLEANLRRFMKYLDGQQERPDSTLADCRSFVHFNALAFIAGVDVHRLTEADYDTISAHEPLKQVRYIPGILRRMRAFAETGVFPSYAGCVWGAPGGRATLSQLNQLRGRVSLMYACVPEFA